MAIGLTYLVTLIPALLFAAAWLIGRGAPSPPSPVRVTPSTQDTLRQVRRRGLWAVTATVIVLGLLVTSAFSTDGIGLAVSPALAGTAGLLTYSLMGVRGRTTEITRTASLHARTWYDHLPGRTVTLWLLCLLLGVGSLVAFGATSSRDSLGRYSSYQNVLTDGIGSEITTSAGPYPGWFYGVPMLVATLILIAATWFALWRTASAPALPEAGLELADQTWRTESSQVLLQLSAGTILLQTAGSLWFGGLAIGNAVKVDSIFVSTPWAATVQMSALLALTAAFICLTDAFHRTLRVPAKALGSLSPDTPEPVL